MLIGINYDNVFGTANMHIIFESAKENLEILNNVIDLSHHHIFS